MDLRIRTRVNIAAKLRLSGRVRLAAVMTLSEYGFVRLLRDIESSPLFVKLVSLGRGCDRIVRYRRFPGAVPAGMACSFMDEISPDRSGGDIQSLLASHPEAVETVRTLGAERFEGLFLAPEYPRTAEEIAASCGMSVRQVEKVVALLDAMEVQSVFRGASAAAPEAAVRCWRIAGVEIGDGDEPLVRFCSPRFAANRYQVDYDRLEELKRRGVFSREELGGLRLLLDRMELANSRRSTVYRIVHSLARRQRAFLRSGEERDLVPFTQTQLARELGIDNSLVSRAIYGKSIEVPPFGERPLRFFLPNNRDVRRSLIREILSREGALTDRRIGEILKDRYGIAVSRRTVNACRTENKGMTT